MPQPQSADPRGVLDQIDVPQQVKADAWEAYHSASDQNDFRRRFDTLALPQEAKAQLWEQRFGAPVAQPPGQPGFLKELYENTIGGIPALATEYAKGGAEMPGLPPFVGGGMRIARDIGENVIAPQIQNWKTLFSPGANSQDRAMALGKAMMGPGMSNVSEMASQGNVPGAAGAATGQLLSAAAPFVAPPIARGLGKIGSGLEKAQTSVLGLTTGEGSTATKLAAEPEHLAGFTRGRHITEEEMIHDAKQAIVNLRDKAKAKYRGDLAALEQAGHPGAEPAPVMDALEKQMKAFKVERAASPLLKFDPQQYLATPEGAAAAQEWERNPSLKASGQNIKEFLQQRAHKEFQQGEPGKLNFEGSYIANTPENSRGTITKAVNTIQNWDDWSLQGLDRLKQQISDYARATPPGSRARAFVTGLQRPILDQLNKVPGYQEMTGAYHRASELARTAEKELGLGPKATPGQAIRKFSTILKQNNDYRQTLLQALSEHTDKDLLGQAAGQAMSKWTPRGLAGVRSGFILLSGLLSPWRIPTIAAEAAAMSPRAVGHLLAVQSAAKRFAQGAGDVLFHPNVVRGYQVPAMMNAAQPLQPPDHPQP